MHARRDSALRLAGNEPPRPAGPRTPPGAAFDRNPGMPLDLDLVLAQRVNRSAAERRAATIPTRRTVKKQWQAAWLLRAITLIDLTTLAGDDTAGNVRRLCAKAMRPLRPDLTAHLGVESLAITTGAVCVYHQLVPTAVEALAGSGIPVAAVSTGFPAGLSRRSRHGSPRSAPASPPVRKRSISSSPAATSSPGAGTRSTTKCRHSATPAAMRT